MALDTAAPRRPGTRRSNTRAGPANIEFLKEMVLTQLKLKIKNIENYVIADEHHQDTGIHIHCFFEMLTPLGGFAKQ
jgi:hypothetical protein